MSIDGVLNGLLRFALPAAAIAAVAVAASALFDHLNLDRRAAERRTLLQRNTELTVSALAPGSALACLDGGAGEAIENACEKAIFADPPSAAGAVAFTAARLALLAQAAPLAQGSEAAFADALAPARRAIELDRYGIAAHVLAVRDGCTFEHCAAFSLLRDTVALKANLKAQAFDNYVARYAAAWNKAEAKKEPKDERKDGPKDGPMSETQPPAPAPPPVASAPQTPAPSAHPVASKYDFPSAASIPPVSIMNAEPPLPPPPADNAAAPPATNAAAPPAANAAAPVKLPVPPKRPQAQAATPPAR